MRDDSVFAWLSSVLCFTSNECGSHCNILAARKHLFAVVVVVVVDLVVLLPKTRTLTLEFGSE